MMHHRHSPMPSALPRDRRGGFLLVEALATLAIGAFIIAGLAGIVTLVMRFADRSAASLQAVEITGRAMAAIERDLAGAVRQRWPGAPQAGFVFVGGPSEVMFVVDRPAGDGLTQPVAIRWAMANNGTRPELTRSEAPLPPGAIPGADLGFPAPSRVDTGGISLRFSYFGHMPNTAQEVLTDAWPTPTRYPIGVRIALTDRASGRVTSQIRVPLPRNAEVGCAGSSGDPCSLIEEGADGEKSDRRRQEEGAPERGDRPRPNSGDSDGDGARDSGRGQP